MLPQWGRWMLSLQWHLQLSETSSAPPVARFGDCEAPATIFAAVYSGHRFAEEFETEPNLRRERIRIEESSRMADDDGASTYQ